MTIIHISSLNASFFQMFLEHMKKSHHRLSVCVNDPSVDNIHDLRTSIRRMTTIYKILSKRNVSWFFKPENNKSHAGFKYLKINLYYKL